MKLLLFDIDGTLLLTDGAGMRAMERAGKTIYGESFTFEGVNPSGGMDPLLVAEAATNCRIDNHDVHHDRFRDEYERELIAELQRVGDRARAMPGIVELLAELRPRKDVVLGMLTGNYPGTAAMKLRAVGIDPAWFVITAFGDEAPSRPELVKLAMAKYFAMHGNHPHPTDVIVIGDTPRDVHCAKENGCVAFAVATGHYSVEDLRSAGANVVVRSLADHGPLMKMID